MQHFHVGTQNGISVAKIPLLRLCGDELIVPGPASIRPAVIDLVRAAGVEILGLTAEESGLESFYRDLVRHGAAPS